MNNLLFVNNTADMRILRQTVRNLEHALDTERALTDKIERQRNSQIFEATVYANMARTLAKELGFSLPDLKSLRQECQNICENDLKKRGFKKFAEEPPKFTVPNWQENQGR